MRALALIALLAGCTQAPVIYTDATTADRPESDFNADLAGCNMWLRGLGLRYNNLYGPAALEDCMASRGWAAGD